MPARHLRIREDQIARAVCTDHHRPRTECDRRPGLWTALAQDLKIVRARSRSAAGRTHGEPGLQHRATIETHLESLTRGSPHSVECVMNDSVTSMRLVALAALVAGCADDPTLSVDVHHPIAVASTTVTVYESSVFDCEKIEFSELSADELDAAKVSEVTIDPTTNGKLSNVSRTDKKVIVARGFDTFHSLITVGCAEAGEVSGTTKVDITTNIAGTASIGMSPDTDQFAIAMVATEPDGTTLEGRPVSWTVYGPAGSKPYSMTNVTVDGAQWKPTKPSCTTSGLARLHPMPPSTIGGYAVQMRLAWSTGLPPMVSLLTNIDLSFNELVTGTMSRYCAPRISGTTRRLVCIDGTTARDFSVTVDGGIGTLTLSQSQPLAAGNGTPLGVFAVPNGTNRDVYAITDTGFLIALFGAQAPTNPPPAQLCGVLANCVDDFIVAPACDVPARLVLHTKRLVQVEAMPVRGGTPSDIATGAGTNDVHLNNAGCVTELDSTGSTPTSRQVVVFDFGKQLANVFVPAKSVAMFCTSDCQTLDLVAGAAAGFTDGGEPRLIATSVDATGVILAQLVLAVDKAGNPRFVERTRVPAASVPEHIVVGQLDADQEADMLWTSAAKRGNATAFEVSYARTVDNLPLEAISPARAVAVDDLQIADLTGDGIDDVVVTGTADGVHHGVVVIPMNVPAPAVNLGSDPTCNP